MNMNFDKMDAFYIDETMGTPRVSLNQDGNFLIQGRSLPIDPVGFYNPVINWIKSFQSDNINFDIRLDYLNTSSSKQLYIILELLSSNPFIKSLNVNWYYEENDEDGYNTGREFESLVNLKFNFKEYEEVLD